LAEEYCQLISCFQINTVVFQLIGTLMTSLDLPSRNNIMLAIDEGSPEDYHLVRLYYSWYAGWFYQHRLRMIATLMNELQVGNLLDVGFGSGIFIKELLKYADRVTGIDIHSSFDGIHTMLIQEGVDLSRIELHRGSVLDIPYPEGSFDAVTCVSVLEHFENPGDALQEIRRVLTPRGVLLAGFPTRTRLTAMLFRILGYRDIDIHPASHETIIAAVRTLFEIQDIRMYPMNLAPMYIACRAQNPQ
jgi:SAM-dependent methyltransferase